MSCRRSGSGCLVSLMRHVAGLSRDDRGSFLVTALLGMLVLGSVGMMITMTVAEDLQIARNHIETLRCLYIAESGLNYAVIKLNNDINWAGLSSPGRAVGNGYFTVVVSDSTALGVPLAAGKKRVNTKGYFDSAEREIEVILQ